MKIGLHVGQLLQRVPGGIGRYTHALFTALPAAGVASSRSETPRRYRQRRRVPAARGRPELRLVLAGRDGWGTDAVVTRWSAAA